jgi:hypothetical protein
VTHLRYPLAVLLLVMIAGGCAWLSPDCHQRLTIGAVMQDCPRYHHCGFIDPVTDLPVCVLEPYGSPTPRVDLAAPPGSSTPEQRLGDGQDHRQGDIR